MAVLVLGISGPVLLTHTLKDSIRQHESSRDAVTGGLVLTLTAPRTVFYIGEPIEITFRIENKDSERYYTIFPGIRPAGLASGHSPESEIIFLISNSKGQQVPYIGYREIFSIAPSAEGGLSLVPGAFFGRSVRIDDGLFAYAIDEPGLYTVEAEFRHSGREWVRRWLEIESRGESDLSYELDSLFDGVVRAPPIEIELKRPN